MPSFLNNVLVSNTSGSSTDFGTQVISRTVDYTGGTPGFVCSALRVDTYVNSTSANAYEWAITGVVHNQSLNGENVGIYGQGNKLATACGPTWGGTIQVIEQVPTNNPTTGTVGLEVDCNSNGTDNNGNRVGIDVVCARQNLSGTATTTAFGVRVQNNNDGSNSLIENAFSAYNCQVSVAFDCAYATVTSGALRMATGQPILFDVSGYHQLAVSGDYLQYSVNNATILKIAGTTSETSYVQSNFVPFTTNEYSLGSSSYLWSTVYADTSTINTSDERLKTDITPSDLGLGFINALRPVSYKWRADGHRDHYGLIAQEVRSALNDHTDRDFAGWVLADPVDPDSKQMLRYEEFISPLIKAVQELSAEVVTLKAELAALKSG
jgi:hypothetical protein